MVTQSPVYASARVALPDDSALDFDFGRSMGPFCPKDPKRDPRRSILFARESHLARD